jgi:hypothetical protein
MSKKKQWHKLESLEDRLTPSTAGVPWGSPWPYSNLTLSFVPDGTMVNGYQSTLFQSLGSQATTKAWEGQILKAAQTWADAANINVGLVADGGQALGAPGLIQGDTRFGDIRMAAEPMGLNAPLAVGSPYSPVAGTLSGDLIFNSSYSFAIGSGNDIYTVALHELGHSFGIGDNNNPGSVLFNTYQGIYTGLQPGDVAAIQFLYGTRGSDAYEGPAGNNTLSTAAVMKLPEIAADVGGISQTDYFQYKIPSYADRTVTVSVQNGGVSLLMPTLSIYNSSGVLLGSSSASDAFSDSVSITLSNIKRGMTIYLGVSSTRTDVFGIGSYRLKVDSGQVSEKQIAAIDAALNGTTIVYRNFWHSTSTIATAAQLDRSNYQIDPRFNYAIDAKLNDASDVDFFSITTPATAPQALIFTAGPGQGSLLSPELTVYDASGNVVNAQILSNETSGYVVQVLSPLANARYYVSVSANPFAASINDQGTYRLGVNYSNTPIVLQSIDTGTLSATDTVNVIAIQSTEVQLYHFVLSVNTNGAIPGVEVQMQLLDASGNLVMSLLCQDGNIASADVQLQQSSYTIRFVGLDTNGAALPTTYYTLLGMNLTNPLDPVPINPTQTNPTTTTTPTTTSTTTTTTPTTTSTSTLLVVTPPTIPTPT